MADDHEQPDPGITADPPIRAIENHLLRVKRMIDTGTITGSRIAGELDDVLEAAYELEQAANRATELLLDELDNDRLGLAKHTLERIGSLGDVEVDEAPLLARRTLTELETPA